MRNSTKTEIRALREVAHFLLPLVCCEFCGLPLLDPKLADKVFGNKTHSPLKNLKLTTHHRNGKHRDNSGKYLMNNLTAHKVLKERFTPDLIFAICGNKSLVHRPCHGKHEMTLSHKKKGLKTVKPLHQRAKTILKKILSVDIEKLDETFTASEMKFLHIADNNKKCTRYELRRLKKLAAKVEGRSVKTKSKVK
jgi:hypothetical protein